MLRLILALFLFAVIGAARPAQAATCQIDISDVSFAGVDTLGPEGTTTTADLSITCQEVEAEAVTVCVSLGAGTGGETGGVRQMVSPTSSVLGYGFFADPGYGTPWGSAYEPNLGAPQRFILPASGGTASEFFTIYARTVGAQVGASPGSYTSAFSGPNAQIDFLEGTTFPCTGVGGELATTTFTTDAEVEANCLVQATDINFGSIGLITEPINATGGITITCTPGAEYSIELDGGLRGATNPEQRLMQRTGGTETVTYGLYSEGNVPWGDSPGVNTVDGTATGTDVMPVYGRVPPQQAVPGTYNDTVVVTVRY